MANFQNILFGRSIRDSHSFQHHQRQVENALEDSLLLDHNYAIEDLPLHDNVSSTISIAMSNDGHYYASTHGDHTVKVFDFHNNHREHRVFHGHPRTPWTVKFNPRNSNFVASGCLGFQVRLWSISDNSCIGLLRLDAPIISLSFHPKGEYIAIASGQRLEIWHWTAQLAPTNSNTRRYQGSPGHSSDLTQRPVHYMEKAVVHPRNMRATIFHPNGEYLFVAAPDTPRQQHSSLTYCSLFAIKFSSLLRGDDWSVGSEPIATTPTIDLTVFPTILSQVSSCYICKKC
jgi:hypothetical protein